MDDPPPPPYSPTTQIHTTEVAPLSRWHPKMSPYRISVIITTVLLGTLKAVFVYRGVSMVSTTLEWIGGVVFALLFFALDQWESNESYPKRLHPFFTFDCTELLWRILAILSISQPRYRSDESRGWLRGSPSIPVTGYRIMVSTTVVAVGSTKAVLTFLGQNTSTNYLDWILGVLITSVLYYIGLYESNSANLAPNFFVRDQYPIILRICRDISFLLGAGLSLWIMVEAFYSSLSSLKSDYHLFMTTVPKPSESFILVESLGIFALCAVAFLVIMTFTGIVAVSLLIVWGLLQERELFRLPFRRGTFASRYYDRLTNRILNVTTSPPQLLQQAWAIVLSILLLGVYVFGVVTLLSFFVGMISLMKVIAEDFHLHGGFGKWMEFTGMQLLLGYVAIMTLVTLYRFIRSLSFFLPV